MYNVYDMVIVEPKVNKKKIIIVSIIAVVVLFLAIFGGIKIAQHRQKKHEQEEAIKIEQEKYAERKKQEEAKKVEEEKRLRNAKPLTEEQYAAIDNIYESEEKRVFLTFDDGPTTTVTPLILDLLKSENIKATFFVLGDRAKSNPELIKREYDEGHYIANHGYSHVYSQIYKNAQNVLDEYNYTESCIQEALENTEYHSRLFRFPGGSTGGYYSKTKTNAKSLLKENNIAYLDWNALSNDADGAHTREAIMENIRNTVGDKNSVVILMHDAYDKILTYESLPDVINFLRGSGYAFKNIYDIL